MGEKQNTPWSIGLLGGKSGVFSFFGFSGVLVIFLVVIFGGGYLIERAENYKHKPVFDNKQIVKALKIFRDTNGKMPDDLRDLNHFLDSRKTGNSKNGKKLFNFNLFTDRSFSLYHYHYIYSAGNVSGDSLAGIWAIPFGEYAGEGETYFFLISPKNVETWRGPALPYSRVSEILDLPASPTYEAMSSFNMAKDVKNKSSIFSINSLF